MAGGALMDGAMPMRDAVEQYLVSRRKLGFALHIEGQELSRFARFADQVGHTGALTTDLLGANRLSTSVRWLGREAPIESFRRGSARDFEPPRFPRRSDYWSPATMAGLS